MAFQIFVETRLTEPEVAGDGVQINADQESTRTVVALTLLGLVRRPSQEMEEKVLRPQVRTPLGDSGPD